MPRPENKPKITFLDLLNFQKNPKIVINKLIKGPFTKYFQDAISKLDETKLKGAMAALGVWILFMVKQSMQVRGWAKTVLKFVAFVCTLLGFAVCGAMLGLKWKMKQLPTSSRPKRTAKPTIKTDTSD